MFVVLASEGVDRYNETRSTSLERFAHVFRTAETTDEKQHLLEILRELSFVLHVFERRDGSRVQGRVIEEHHRNGVDDAGVWRVSAGVTLRRSDGSLHDLDLLDVRALHAPGLS